MSDDADPRVRRVGGATERGRVLNYDRVLEIARNMFIERNTLDMQELARRLAVSRATLYRIVSSRERLLGDVIWSLSVMALRAAVARTNGHMDLRRVLLIGQEFRDSALASEPMKRFVEDEPSTAAAVLHTRGPVRDRLIDEWRKLLVQAMEVTNSTSSIDPRHAAEIVVDLGASSVYDDLASGERSDPDLVAVVLRSLFR